MSPSNRRFTQMLFSFKPTLHLGFFFTLTRQNGFESAELNWFAATLTQTTETLITYPIIPRVCGKQTFPLRLVDGFHSQVLWLTQSSSFQRHGGAPQKADSVRDVIQQPMTARMNGIRQKSSWLITCFVFLIDATTLMKQKVGGHIFSSAVKKLIALKHPEIGLRYTKHLHQVVYKFLEAWKASSTFKCFQAY